MSNSVFRLHGRINQLLCSGLLACVTLVFTGCQQQGLRTADQNEQALKERLAPLNLPDPDWSEQALKQGSSSSSTAGSGQQTSDEDSPAITDIWQRIRHGFQLLDEDLNNPRIDQQRLWYASRTGSLETIAKRSTPYIHYIVEALDNREMPLELALLPVIESAYNPKAYSRSHAAGLWQFIPSTGRVFKLKQTRWYDGRRDITASTEAALDYLAYLNNMFGGDWLLTLAAYNAGEGTVSRAIKRNQQLGLPTDYWNLQLPKQAQDYVPRLLSLAQLVASPQAYALRLPKVPDEPYFAQVSLEHQLDLKRIASLAKVPAEHIHELNPAFKEGVILDGPQHVLVPTQQAQRLERKLAELSPDELLQVQLYVVRSGDTLSGIAQRHGTSVTNIRQLNQLKTSQLRIGQHLKLTGAPQQVARQEATATTSKASAADKYQVRKGDTLGAIAARHGTSVKQLRQLNTLQHDRLRIGQTLLIKPGSTSYVVRSGDTLSAIAKRHKVSLRQLQNWNPSQSKLLKPGQTLTLHL